MFPELWLTLDVTKKAADNIGMIGGENLILFHCPLGGERFIWKDGFMDEIKYCERLVLSNAEHAKEVYR